MDANKNVEAIKSEESTNNTKGGKSKANSQNYILYTDMDLDNKDDQDDDKKPQ